jgi:hypothetical protein
LLEGIGRSLQHDVAFGFEHRVVASRQRQTRDGDVRVLARQLRNYRQIHECANGRPADA